MKVIIVILISFFLTVGHSETHPQNFRDGRIEIEVSSLSDAFYMMPVGSHGLVLFGMSDRVREGRLLFEFTKFNTRFQKEWQVVLPVNRRADYRMHYYDKHGQKLYFLLSDQRGGVLYREHLIVELDINTSATRTIEGNFDTYAVVRDFLAYNGVAYLGGHFYPPRSELFFRQALTFVGLYIPAIFGSLRYELESLLLFADFDKGDVVPFSYKPEGHNKVTGMSADKDKGQVNVLFIDKPDRHTVNFEVLQFDTLQNVQTRHQLHLDNYDLTSGKVINISDTEQIVIGTYALRPRRHKKSSYNLEQAQATTSIGLYYAKIKDGKQYFMRTYPFHTLDNFYNYLSAKARMRLDRSASRSLNRGGVGIEYNLLVHDLIEYKQNYVLVAEAYYPEYDRRCYYRYNPYRGYSERTCYDIFLGYRFTHTIVAAFDEEGRLVWDNSFGMWDVITTNLKPQVRYFMEHDEILFLYAHGNKIKSKVLAGKEIVETGTSLEIELAGAKEQGHMLISSGIEYWYDNYFIAYSFQHQRGGARQGRENQRAFYFYKIKYR